MTPLHRKHYEHPYNEFLNWNNWNSLYDFAMNNQDRLYGRTGLSTHIDCFRFHIKKMMRTEIKWFDSRFARKKYINKNNIKRGW